MPKGNGTIVKAPMGRRRPLVWRWPEGTLPKGASIRSFAMRELDSTDEAHAALEAELRVPESTINSRCQTMREAGIDGAALAEQLRHGILPTGYRFAEP